MIVARGLSIDQNWQLTDAELAVGDAVVRQLEISITGASALFVPPLLDGAAPQVADPDSTDVEPAVAGFLSYPEDPVVTETMERGVMSGTRTEMVTYIAQSGGMATFPRITLNWYNLTTEQVEEIVLDGRKVSVAMPLRIRTAADRQKTRLGALLLVLVVALIWAIRRSLWPVMRPGLDRIRGTYDGSAYGTHRLAIRRAAASDLGGLVQALELRATRGHSPSRPLHSAVEALNRAVYRDGKTGVEIAQEWQDVRQALRQDRPGFRDTGRNTDGPDLAPLNPFS